jgi:hypothetical protein
MRTADFTPAGPQRTYAHPVCTTAAPVPCRCLKRAIHRALQRRPQPPRCRTEPARPARRPERGPIPGADRPDPPQRRPRRTDPRVRECGITALVNSSGRVPDRHRPGYRTRHPRRTRGGGRRLCEALARLARGVRSKAVRTRAAPGWVQVLSAAPFWGRTTRRPGLPSSLSRRRPRPSLRRTRPAGRRRPCLPSRSGRSVRVAD